MGHFYLRNATMEDAWILYEWVNENEVRKNSFQTQEIQWEEHRKWLQKKLESESCDIYICMFNDMPIGQVRVDRDEDEKMGYIDYSVQSDYRGRGHGTKMIRCMEMQLNHKYDVLKAYVKKQNIASRMLFKNSGYTEREEQDFMIYYKKI